MNLILVGQIIATPFNNYTYASTGPSSYQSWNLLRSKLS